LTPATRPPISSMALVGVDTRGDNGAVRGLRAGRRPPGDPRLGNRRRARRADALVDPRSHRRRVLPQCAAAAASPRNGCCARVRNGCARRWASPAPMTASRSTRPPFELIAHSEAVEVTIGPRIGLTKAVDHPWRYGLKGSRLSASDFRRVRAAAALLAGKGEAPGGTRRTLMLRPINSRYSAGSTLPTGGASGRLPLAISRSYQIEWCCFAQFSSTVPSHMASNAPSSPTEPM
jgi:hypothetical protein